MTALLNRQSLLRRGWYVASEVELAFMGLSGRAHDLLIILKHLQGSNPDAFPTRERLAEILGVSVRTVQNSLNELRRKGGITSRRTGRCSRHTAAYGQLSVAELQTLFSGEVQVPDELLAECDVQDPCTSEVQDPCTPIEEEPLTKNQIKTTTSLREVGGAATPEAETPQEDEMGRKGARAGWLVADELDPVASLGLWDAQEIPDSPADGLEDNWLPLRPKPTTGGRQTATRTQAQLDTPMALAIEFERAVRAADWDAGPSPVNRAALARNLSAWKRDGVSADQVRRMITRYVTDSGVRSTGRTPWIDFVGKRHKLLAVEKRASENTTVEEHRHADADYWIGSTV